MVSSVLLDVLRDTDVLWKKRCYVIDIIGTDPLSFGELWGGVQ